MIVLSAKSHMHIFNMLMTSVHSFQIDCLNTLGGVDYTNLLPNIEALHENCLNQKCRNFVKNDFLAC